MNEKNILQLSEKLMRFRTTKDNTEELKKCAKFIRDFFADTNLIVREYKFNKKPAVVISFGKSRKPELMLMGHFDVVEAEDRMFLPRIKGKRLYGRGSDDMKAADALMMLLMKQLWKENKKRSVALCLTSDEEVGGEDCTLGLIEKGYRPKVVLAPDGGKNMEIVVKEKGILQLKVTFRGKAAHGSTPWLGKNAIENAMQIYPRIKALFPKTTKKDRWKPTVNLGKIEAGDAVNMVPDRAFLYLDIRYPETCFDRKILKKIRRVCGGKVEIAERGNVLDTDINNRYILALKKEAESVLKRKVKFGRAHGASDARHFAKTGIPAFLFQPIGHGAHSSSEYLEIKSLVPYYNILYSFITEHIGNENC